MKFGITTLVLLFVSTLCLAQQKVGNGGGDAEIEVLEMAPNLRLWNKFCSENIQICWSSPKLAQIITLNFEQALNGLVLEEILFSDTNHPSFCNKQTLVLRRSDLYVDSETAKPKPEISLILINAILNCRQINFQVSGPPPRLLPEGKILDEVALMIFNYEDQSGLVSSFEGQNASQLLSKETGCSKFRFLNGYRKEFNIQCLSDGTIFKVTVTSSNPLTFFSVVQLLQRGSIALESKELLNSSRILNLESFERLTNSVVPSLK